MPAAQRRQPRATPQAARPTKAERRRALLDHARRLVLERGFSTVTLEAVAEAAGQTPAAAARVFADRGALLAALIDELRTETVDRWALAAAEQPDPVGKFHQAAEAHLKAIRAGDPATLLLHRALADCADPTARVALATLFREAEALLASIVLEGQQAGVFRRSLEPRVAAWEVLRSALGYAALCGLEPPLFGEPDYPARGVDCLLQGLLKTDV